MGTFWKCVLVKFVLTKFVLTKDLVYTDYGLVRKLPSLHGKKSTPTPKISDTAKAYFVKLNFILKNIENKSLVCLSFPWGLEKNILDILRALQKPQTAFRMPNLKLKSQTMFIKNASLLPFLLHLQNMGFYSIILNIAFFLFTLHISNCDITNSVKRI